MALSGSYLAWMLQAGALPPIRMYRDVVLTKVLPEFDNLGAAADEFERRERERLDAESPIDDDGGTLAEEAHDRAVTYYIRMSQIRQGVLNLFTAGLFHLFEQQLCNVWHDATIVAMGVASPDGALAKIADWMALRVEYDLRNTPFWDGLEELRLIANVTKHAEGRSAEELRECNPGLFVEPRYAELVGLDLSQPRLLPMLRRPLAGEDLYIRREKFEALADNVIAALRAISAHFESNSDREYPR